LRIFSVQNKTCTYFFRTFDLEKQNMETKTLNARFDTRVSEEQKELFELAATLGGFRTFTEFVVSTLQEKAKIIIEEHHTILASERDRKIFFDALTNPPKPNDSLKAAAKRYKKLVK